MALKVYRMCFVFVSFSVMLARPESPHSFFKSLLLIALPLLYDYWSIFAYGVEAKDKYHKILGGFGIIISLYLLIFTMLYFTDVISIEINNGRVENFNNTIYICNGGNMMYNLKTSILWIYITFVLFPIFAGLEIFGEHKRQLQIKISESGQNRTIKKKQFSIK